MLGPTAKALVGELAATGLQLVDIGHIDSEYEWFQMGATSKVKLPHKHTAEHNFDEDITLAAQKVCMLLHADHNKYTASTDTI